MNTPCILRLAAAALLFFGAACSTPPAAAGVKRSTMEYDAATGQWKPAGPAPSVVTYPRDPKKGSHLSARAAGLQAARCLVMAAKTPMIGAVLLGAAMAGPNGDPRGIDRFIEGFDPGPAMDRPPDPGH